VRAAARAAAAALATLAALGPSLAGAQEPHAPAPPEAPAGAGLLHVFNDSGPTLIRSDQIVTADGRRLVSLPRRTYAVVPLPQGVHVLEPDPPSWKQRVVLNVEASRNYFVVVAYRPERSWAAPMAGTPLVLREITPEQAAPLLAEFERR